MINAEVKETHGRHLIRRKLSETMAGASGIIKEMIFMHEELHNERGMAIARAGSRSKVQGLNARTINLVKTAKCKGRGRYRTRRNKRPAGRSAEIPR